MTSTAPGFSVGARNPDGVGTAWHADASSTSDTSVQRIGFLVIEVVGGAGFRICFDPGNLLYYAGERPEQSLPKLAPYVAGMCIKDETGGEVLEYALIAGLIVVAAIAVIGTVGTKVLAKWQGVSDGL